MTVSYIEDLVDLKRGSTGLEYRKRRRPILLMHDDGWANYFDRIRGVSDDALEACSVEQWYQDFRRCVSSHWSSREVWHLVMPLDQQDWRWCRMQVMRERYATLRELAVIYNTFPSAVDTALSYCGYEPAFVGGGLTSFKVRYWQRSCTNRVDLWQCLNRERFSSEERRLAKRHGH
jgi:hypothetical protein